MFFWLSAKERIYLLSKWCCLKSLSNVQNVNVTAWVFLYACPSHQSAVPPLPNPTPPLPPTDYLTSTGGWFTTPGHSSLSSALVWWPPLCGGWKHLFPPGLLPPLPHPPPLPPLSNSWAVAPQTRAPGVGLALCARCESPSQAPSSFVLFFFQPSLLHLRCSVSP